MRKFKFNLEKILQLRKFREEECKLALGQAVSLLNKIENDIKLTALKRHNAASQRFNNPQEMFLWDNFVLRLDQEGERLAQKAAQAEIVVEEKRALYLEAQKNLKVFEKLKEKKQTEYRREYLNYEMNQVDELTSSRYNSLV
ncbi:MAG: flagellar export protein FliJ [Treponema sp.]|nr:flagellar export protein FliJ [Treponema sp.]MCL2272131.1 flagellar export protein FliJ [Treponema sp.]